MVEVFLAEEPDTAGDAGSGSIAKWAKRLAADVVADVKEQIDVARFTLTMFQTLQQLNQPESTLSAWCAFAAGFVTIELSHPQYRPHDAGILIQNDDAT